MRIGLVGCGHIGTVHAYALEQLHLTGLVDARLVATYDADPERAARLAGNHGGTPMARLDDLLDAVDVVWVCTWTAGHLEAVTAAVARNLPVFCEKPLAPDLTDCLRIAELLGQVPHQVGLVLRHAPVFRNVADIVGSLRYGAPMAVVFRDDQYFPIQGMYGSTWRSDVAKAGGGTLIEHSIHDVDVLAGIVGAPVSVTAHTASRFGYPGIEDTATVGLAYAQGASAALVSVWHQVTTRPSTRRLEVFCEDAFLWTEDDYLGPLHVETSDGTEVISGEPPAWIDRLAVPEVLAKPLAQYCEPSKAFLDALSGSGGAARGFPDVELALAAHRVVDAAYTSAANGGAPIALSDPLGRAKIA
ncbi:MAG: Gfo/Idh/MocA family oxidoreductase [Actinobacteria bacterium]|nr:Gfo/Idh/MocA family oxidoreductase [Actinomycetota bacterium]